MTNQTEVMLKRENKSDVIEILNLLGELSQSEQEKMLAFMQGMRFKRDLDKQKETKLAG